jgi:alpha-mannosidase
LPQIYKKSGIDYFVTQKMEWNDTNQLPFKLFWWQSPDGSKVLAYFPHGYGNEDLRPLRLADDLVAARQRSTGMTELMDLYGVGDHGGGPTRAMLDEGFHWTDPSAASVAAMGGVPVTPKYEFNTAQSFFSLVEKNIAPDSPVWNYQTIAKGYSAPAAVPGKVAIPTWDSELYFEYHRGVYTTQANQKHNMRTAEEEMLNAEKWSSLAWLDGLNYPSAELTEDWKKVLFNQFHDLAAGSGIAAIYRDAQKDYDWVRMSTGEISGGALQTLADHINTAHGSSGPETQSVVVFNPLGWERDGEVSVRVHYSGSSKEVAALKDPAGRVIVATIASYEPQTGVAELLIPVEHIPALGYETLLLGAAESRFSAGTGHLTANGKPAFDRIEPASTVGGGHSAQSAIASTPSGGSLSVSNQLISISVDKSTGCVTSVFDQRSNVETLAADSCGNQLQFFKDSPKQYDAWNIDPGTLDLPPAMIGKADSVELATSADGSPAIRATFTWQSSKFVQTITLNGDQIDIDNDIDWHEKHVLLKAAFPLAVTSDFATYEIPYGSIERPTTRNNSFDKAQFEVEAMRWADLSGAGADGKVHGLSILNQDKYGYDAAGNVLRITLLRSPTWPDPDADQGEHHFHYALYPHAGTWKDALTVRHGWEYDYPLQAVVTTAHAGSLPAEHSFASVEPDNIVLTAVKKAEDQNGQGVNGLIFRAYEWAGKETTAEFHVPPGATGATATNLMEQPEGGPLAVAKENGGDVVKVPIHLYEIVTIRVDYPKQ